MATRLEYRTNLQTKLVGLEDEGYGDFEFTDAELNTYLELAVARLYPSLYRRVAIEGITPTGYGNNFLGYVLVDQPDRVYQVEDAVELIPVSGWRAGVDKILNINTDEISTVNVYYIDAYVMPPDDATSLGAPGVYTPLIVLGALIEALESRHDTGVHGDPPPVGQHTELSLIDRLASRYESLKRDLSMSLPFVVC